MTDRHTPDRLLDGLEPPRPPEALRARALAAAEAALNRKPEPAEHGIWSRLWCSTPLRIAWAATVAALLLAHVGLSVHSTQPQAPTTNQPAYLIAGAPPDTELAEIVSLPRLSTDRDPSFELDTERSENNAS